MRTLLIGMILIFACNVHASYDSSWFQTEFWSGEWPHGYAVSKPNITVAARTAMDRDLAPTIRCELPFKAVFSPWNDVRNSLSQVHYFTASKIVNLVAKNDFTFTDNNKSQDIPIKKGQIIEYLIYGAEGYFTIRINGEMHPAYQDLFDNVEDVNRDEFVQEEWLQLNCVGGETAWIDTNDLFTKDSHGDDVLIDGIWSASIGGAGIDDYGHARDLTDDEVKNGH